MYRGLVLAVAVTVISIIGFLNHNAYADSVIATIPVGISPETIVFDSSNHNLYESNAGSGTVLVINGTTNSVSNSIHINSPTAIAFDSLNNNLYVDQELVFGKVNVINGTTNKVVGSTIPVGGSPIGITFDSSNGNLYVSAEASNSVTVINGTTNTVVGSPIPVGKTPVEMAFDSANGDIYVANFFSNSVSVIDGATNTVVDTINVGVAPFGVAVDSTNGYVYVSNHNSNSVSVIDGATNTVVSTIPVGIGPAGIGFDSANGHLYVTDETANSVSVIDGATNTVVETIPVGKDPFGVAVDSSNGYVYVTNDGDNTVSVISNASIPNPIAARWTFNDGNTNIAKDVSGNGNDGIIHGAKVLPSNDCVKFDCLSFDGVSSVVSIPNNLSLNFGSKGSFSISLWMKSTQSGTGSTGFGWLVDHRRNNDSIYRGYTIGDRSGIIDARIRDGIANDVVVSSTSNVNDGKFHQVVFVVDRSTQTSKLYIDSNLQTSASIATVGNIDTAFGLHLGGTAFPDTLVNFFNGTMDQVTIFHQALPPSEIQTLFSKGF